MAMTSVSHRAQILPVATPATAAVRPARRVVQVAAKQEVQQKFVARTGIAAAAAAALLVVCPRMLDRHAWYHQSTLSHSAASCTLVVRDLIAPTLNLLLKVTRTSFVAGIASVCADCRPTGAKAWAWKHLLAYLQTASS